MLVDAKASDQNQPNVYPFGAESSKFAFQIRKEDGKLFWKIEGVSAVANLPSMDGGTFGYMTAIMRDTNKQTFFDGIAEPTSGSGYKSNTSIGYSGTGFCLGGHGKTDTSTSFVGTLKSFRQYSRALTAAEVEQNRKVDDFRYFGKFLEADVIVPSTYAALQGNEPDGGYDVDGAHVYGPREVNGKEIEYACDGYIVEVGGGDSAWSNATAYAGNSYTYTVGSSPERVRLTWKWKATRGLRTAADYSFADYSQAGLLWNYDGIRNQGGTDADHDPAATTWKNLGSGGPAYDLSWNGETTTGEWAAATCSVADLVSRAMARSAL